MQDVIAVIAMIGDILFVSSAIGLVAYIWTKLRLTVPLAMLLTMFLIGGSIGFGMDAFSLFMKRFWLLITCSNTFFC